MSRSPGAHRALLLTVPGLAALLAREARAAGLSARVLGNDGRADVVAATGRLTALRGLRLAEDVLLATGTLSPLIATRRAAAPDWSTVDGALRVLAAENPTARRAGLRPVVRVRTERAYTRTELRTAIERGLGRRHDPSDDATELWVVQVGGQLHTGLRVKALSRRTTDGRDRPGALRPVLAAALVALAGDAHSLLDPCCGTGTIVAEARAAGIAAVGGDLDPATPAGMRLDARRLPFAARSFGAVVTNLPFGTTYTTQGLPAAWYRRTLTEAVRVAPRAVVLMAPTRPFRQALGRLPVTLERTVTVSVQGRPAKIWVLDSP